MSSGASGWGRDELGINPVSGINTFNEHIHIVIHCDFGLQTTAAISDLLLL